MRLERQLSGRSALITGASQGLGRAIAEAFVAAGASVFICGRDANLLEGVRAGLALHCGTDQSVGARVTDVTDEEDVAALVDDATRLLPKLSILINNAGVQGPTGAVDEVDWKEWVRTIEINLLGSVLVARAVIPQLRRSGGGKIVQLSGGGATAPMPGLSAYAASKAGVVRFAETLARELLSDGIDVNALAPGALNTRMLEQVLAAGPERVGTAYHARAVEQAQRGGVPLDRPAALAVWLASSASDGITGKLISAVWDPWEELSDHLADLDSDVYTLRRIIPVDRGMGWGDR
ncbi:MAG TPA: SDR family oxidoreductase [Solirubrobacteraceae bacterium]